MTTYNYIATTLPSQHLCFSLSLISKNTVIPFYYAKEHSTSLRGTD